MKKKEYLHRAVKFLNGIPVVCAGLLFFLLDALLVGQPAGAQNAGFPVNTFLRINRPAGLPLFQQTDFKVDPERVNNLPDNFIYGEKKVLSELADYLINDLEGQALWEGEALNSASVLNSWDFKRSGLDYGFISCFGTDRYIYCVTQLENLAYTYLFSGHPALGQFIKEHLLQIAGLPVDFWCHAELRRYTPELPLGMIETADICTAVTAALSATGDLLSVEEREKVGTALRTKGLQTSLNWLEKPNMNNFAAIIASGAFAAARYLNDHEGMDTALGVLKRYMNNSMEADGSYGEGFSYFEYPVRSMLPAILAMTPSERASTFSASGMSKSAGWLAYPFLYASGGDQKYMTLLHFADNGYAAPINQSVNYILAKLYNDPLAAWLIRKSNGKPGFSEKMLELKIQGGMPKPKSPEESGLPLLKYFSSGHCYIRSSWQDDAVVMALWSGDGSRVKYSHQRPELSSICMGAFGEYLVVSPASASYRSALRSLYDQATRSANTIAIDDQNQVFRPAEVVSCKAGNLADLIVSEASQAYKAPMKNVRRSVLFVRDPGYFVIIDKIESTGGMHTYSWRIHLNNKNPEGEFKTIDQNHWYLSRPLANLDVYLFSDQKVETEIGEGYLHGPGRDYSPGGIYEGKLGSSIELEAYNPEKSGSMIYYSVLYPTPTGNSSTKVQWKDNVLSVGRDVLRFSGGECNLEKGSQTEKFRLW